jgi:tetratricopeptide (TPR) repeat protein
MEASATGGVQTRAAPAVSLPPRYRVTRMIAVGGMGAVLAAEDELLRRPVAITVLGDNLAQQERFVKRFEREARTAAGLSGHPNVITIYDVGDHEGRPYIVMERLQGGSVADRIRESAGALPRGQVVTWISQAAAALDFAHERGVVHRDVKPANLLYDERGRLVIADFGIARAAYDSSITASGELLGTAAYVAPEQARGGPGSAASDRYSLAVVAYELLTRRRPFGGTGFVQQARAHLEEEPPAPSEVAPSLPPGVDEVLRRGLAKDPAGRWPSASAFAEALGHALEARDDAAASDSETPEEAAVRRTHMPLGVRGAAGAVTRPDIPRSLAEVPVPPAASRPAAASTGARPPYAATREVPEQREVAFARGRSGARTIVPAILVSAAAVAAVIAGAAALTGGGGDGEGSSERPGASARQGSGANRDRPQATQGEGGSEPAAQPPAGGGTPSGAEASRLNDEGFRLMRAGRHEKAIPLLERAVAAFPRDSTELTYAYALYNLGRSLRLAGRPAEAVPFLERRLRIPNQRDTVARELAAARRAAG